MRIYAWCWRHLGGDSYRNAGHSRFRGNDCDLQRPRVANDASSLRLRFRRRRKPQSLFSAVANKSPATQEADQCKSALASQLDR